MLTPASTSTANVPTVTSITNAASGAATVEAGSWIAIKGTNFASAATTWDNFIVGNVFPTTLAGVTVAIDGRPAPISFVNPTQINALVPATSSLGNVTVVVSTDAGSSAPATAVLAPTSPGMFTFAESKQVHRGRVLDSPTSFEYLAPAGLLGGSTQSRPAKAGDTILLFGTGFGPTTTFSSEIASASPIPCLTPAAISQILWRRSRSADRRRSCFLGIVARTYRLCVLGLDAGRP